MEAAGLIEKIETGKALRFVTLQFHPFILERGAAIAYT